MEEVPAYVHLGLIVSNVLTRQHKPRSGLIWSGDHETGHMLSNMSRSLIHVRYISLLEDFDAIDTYNWGNYVLGFRGCTTDRGSSSATLDLSLVTWYRYHMSLHRQSARRDTWTIGYQPVGVDRRMMTSMLQKVDDMTTGPSCRRPQEPIPKRGARGVKRGARHADSVHGGEIGGGSGGRGHGDPGSNVPGDTFDNLGLDVPTFSLGLTPPTLSYPSGSGTSYAPPPSTSGTSYAPPPLGAVGFRFDAPPPSSTTGLSVPHIPISHASSTDSNEEADEPMDDVTPAQQLGFRHRVSKKMTRFTPSDWH
ncbi:hypothetical protein M9H77_04199 [Catharanthus roseus]|uniref:Uncharacterized protein n=1 Tax=Catharanthus roseus TaxID=4058 RepID=A0ACC0CDF2_CATRO|nr:hypothetical protein M9H77_04199 [Catharanthus roseus]